MPQERWLVERSVGMIPKPDYRKEYIKLLEEVIKSLREEEDRPPEDETPAYVYNLPTVILSMLDRKPALSSLEMKLVCFSDVQDFQRYLIYLDESYAEKHQTQPQTALCQCPACRSARNRSD